MKPVRIALTGYARTGKDSVANVLKSLFNLESASIGNLAKRELDDLCVKHFGFSAFTEDNLQKSKIRQLLIEWVEANEDRLIEQFHALCHHRVVNARIVSIKQMRAWKEIGGVIICVERQGITAANSHEHLNLLACKTLGLIDNTYNNDSDGLNPRKIADFFARYVE